METVYFLDMGVIIGHLVQVSGKVQIDNFSTPSCKFLEKNKSSPKVSCCTIIDKEIPKFLKRWKKMSNEIRKKLNDENYEISKENLYARDVKRAEKIYSLKNKLGKEKLNRLLINIETVIEIRFDNIKNNMLNDVVIKESEIDEELRSHFQAVTKNYSDSQVIASAIQYTTKNPGTILVTTDYTDFNELKSALRMREIFDHYTAPKVLFLNKQKIKSKRGGSS